MGVSDAAAWPLLLSCSRELSVPNSKGAGVPDAAACTLVYCLLLS